MDAKPGRNERIEKKIIPAYIYQLRTTRYSAVEIKSRADKYRPNLYKGK